MNSMSAPPVQASCKECSTVVEVCAFCDKQGCRHPMCYRCVRVALRQEIPQPHHHGG